MVEGTTISMTPNAVQRLETLIAAKEEPSLMLRVYVQGGGCSGFQYGFQFEEQKEEDDLEFEREGVKLLVDSMSFQYLMGSEIDFVDDLMGLLVGPLFVVVEMLFKVGLLKNLEARIIEHAGPYRN